MLNRRDLLRAAALGGGMLAGVGCRPKRPPTPAPASGPDFTVAFLTDPHVFAEKGAAQGTALAVEHAMAQSRAPELAITGGDLAFDILATGKEAADAQYDLFDDALSSLGVPVHHTLGNHDCFGVFEESGVALDDPLFGKGYFVDRFGLERPYYSFDHESWHFVVLDTLGIDAENRKYRGWVDQEQLDWLADDLLSSGKPTVVVGHIPLFSNFIEWMRGTADGIPERVSVVNSHQVASVLVDQNVKLVIAGHLHINESFHYKDITFANLGAVCGNWWNGQREGFEEGYSVLEFRGDNVSWRYIDYGWEVTAEAEAQA